MTTSEVNCKIGYYGDIYRVWLPKLHCGRSFWCQKGLIKVSLQINIKYLESMYKKIIWSCIFLFNILFYLISSLNL